MRTNFSSPLLTLPRIHPWASILGIAAISASGALAQVKVPAQSGSTTDIPGETRPITTVPVPSGQKFPNKSTVTRMTPPTSAPGAGRVTTQPTPNVTTQPTNTVTAIQRVEPKVERIDPVKIQRLADLRKELRISEAATRTRMTLPSDDMFEEKALTTIDKASEGTLRKIVEYIELNDRKKVTVNSFYVADQEGGKELAWSRSLALIEWMTANSTLESVSFRATGPAPVTKATTKPNASNIGETEFINQTELVLER